MTGTKLKGKARTGRRLVGTVLYVVAAFGVLFSLLVISAIDDNYRRNAASGDFAGAGLGIALLTIAIIPSTLIALILGLWLNPPNRWFARSEDGTGKGAVEVAAPAGAAAPTGGRPRSILALMLVIIGVALLAYVVVLLAGGLQGFYKDYEIGGAGLVGLAIQDLITFSPLVGLAIVLFWIAAKVARPRPGG